MVGALAAVLPRQVTDLERSFKHAAMWGKGKCKGLRKDGSEAGGQGEVREHRLVECCVHGARLP